MDWTIGLAIILAIVVVILLVLLIYSGLLAEVNVKAGPSLYGELQVLYKPHVGAYSQVGRLFMETCELAPSLKTIGIYLDDPKETPNEQCRAAVGVIVNDADPALVQRLKGKNYSEITLPKVENVVQTSFPFINTISIYISVWRVYPMLERYVLEHGLNAKPFLEVYDGPTINFFAPLSQHEEFIPPIKVPKVEKKVEPKIEAKVEAKEQLMAEPELKPAFQPEVQAAFQPKVESKIESTNFQDFDSNADLQQQPDNSATTAELIREAVSDEDSKPVHSDSPQEVQTQFTNQQDLHEAISDPAEQQQQPLQSSEPEREARVEPENEPEIEEEEEEELDDFEDRLRRLEEDITDKHSLVRDNVALAEIEEHLKRTGADSGVSHELPAGDQASEAHISLEHQEQQAEQHEPQIQQQEQQEPQIQQQEQQDPQIQQQEQQLQQQEQQEPKIQQQEHQFQQQEQQESQILQQEQQESQIQQQEHQLQQQEHQVEHQSEHQSEQEKPNNNLNLPPAEPTAAASGADGSMEPATTTAGSVNASDVSDFVQSVVNRAQEICNSDEEKNESEDAKQDKQFVNDGEQQQQQQHKQQLDSTARSEASN